MNRLTAILYIIIAGWSWLSCSKKSGKEPVKVLEQVKPVPDPVPCEDTIIYRNGGVYTEAPDYSSYFNGYTGVYETKVDLDINQDGVRDFQFYDYYFNGSTPSSTGSGATFKSLGAANYIMEIYSDCKLINKGDTFYRESNYWTSEITLDLHGNFQPCWDYEHRSQPDSVKYIVVKFQGRRLGWIGMNGRHEVVDLYLNCTDADTIYAGLR